MSACRTVTPGRDRSRSVEDRRGGAARWPLPPGRRARPGRSPHALRFLQCTSGGERMGSWRLGEGGDLMAADPGLRRTKSSRTSLMSSSWSTNRIGIPLNQCGNLTIMLGSAQNTSGVRVCAHRRV